MKLVTGNGFLSEEGKKASNEIANKNNSRLSYVKEIISNINEFVSERDIENQEHIRNHQRLFSLILTTRIIEISEACILMFENGMSNEAQTLFRVFLDAYFIFGNICENEEFVKQYIRSDHATRLKLLNSANKHDSELFKGINNYATEEVKNDLENLIKQEKIQAVNSYNYAHSIKCTEIYDCMYRITSANVHSTPRALEK